MKSVSGVARRIAISLLVGLLLSLALCVLFAYRSTTSGGRWMGSVGDAAPVAATALGKTTIGYDATYKAIRQAFEQSGRAIHDEPLPRWSSLASAAASNMSDDSKFRCTDLAVGWPRRAFCCQILFDTTTRPATPSVRGGLPLPSLLVDRGAGFLTSEPRALPFRPIWNGVLINTAVFSAAAFAFFSFRSWRGARTRARASPLTAARPLGVLRRPSVVLAGTCLALGLLSTGVACTILPIVLRQRSVSAGAVSRPYTFETRDIFWMQRTTHLPPGAVEAAILQDPARFDRELSRLEFSTDPQKSARGPRDMIDAGGPNSFVSTRTGWPFSCLWGARLRKADLMPVQVSTFSLVQVPKHDDARRILNRGLAALPTRPLIAGWLANTVFYAALWLAIFLLLRFRFRTRRRRAGRCPACAYDLRDTPATSPCPECGAPGAPVTAS